jgi:hypothetical protein
MGAMTSEERRKVQAAVRRWRAAHPTPETRREAYLRSLPRQVAEWMAFEGEPVDMRMLERHLVRILAR